MFNPNTCLGLKLFNRNIQLVVFGRDVAKFSPKINLYTRSHVHQQTSEENTKLIYEGKLANRVLYLKSVSILSSLGLGGSYGYVISKKGISVALAGLGFAFTPFLLSPFVIAWFFKRYVTKLYYNHETDIYTAHHYGLLLNKKQCHFKREDVVRSDVSSMLNSFTVGKRPFFVHDEDLIDYESVELYKRMIGLDVVNVEELENKSKQ